MMPTNQPPIVTCPQCGKEHPWDTGNRYRPFCCERCKLIDLGKWANEEYRVVRPVDKDEQDYTEENPIPGPFRS